ncbi:MAG: hypothetical protein HOO85_09165 [Methylotenera sp.]|nr:hypothetical protein [Methylotenera sp.]
MKVLFGTLKIQKGRRIAVDQNVLENLGLDVGDSVKLYIDTEQMCLLIEPNVKNITAKKPARVKNER